MEIPLTEQGNNIKGQYAQGPQGTVPTPEELEQKRAEREQFLDNILPYMRKEEEYSRLQLALMETDVLMGRLPAKQAPGLAGLELMTREVQANGFLSQWMAGQQDAMKRAQEENKMSELERKAREEFEKLPKEEQDKLQKEAIENYNKMAKEMGGEPVTVTDGPTE